MGSIQPWALISPASRGIGFSLTRRVLQSTRLPVVATARKNLEETKAKLEDGLDNSQKKRLTVLQLDVTDEESIKAAAVKCAEMYPKEEKGYLHLAMTIPGILYPEKSPAQIDADHALETFKVNTLGPLLMMKHFAKMLPSKNQSEIYTEHDTMQDRAAWAVMSARVGSITDNSLGGWYSYRASKAAVNQSVKTFDNYLKTYSGNNAIAIGLHPGTVKTGLSKEFWASVKKDKLFDPDWVAERLVDMMLGRGRSIGLDGRGKCWDWDNKEIPP